MTGVFYLERKMASKVKRNLFYIEKEVKIGEKFNEWTVVGEVFKKKNRIYYVKCKCSCGTVSDVMTNTLKNSMSKSCGRCNSKKFVPGAMFGKWKIIKLHSRDSKRNAHYLCKCSCGTIRVVRSYILRKKISKSCGMCNYRKIKKGQIYGRWLVVDYPEIDYSKKMEGKVKCMCICGSGKKRTLSCKKILSKRCLSCGCINKELIHKLTANQKGENSPAWKPSLTKEDRIKRRTLPENREFVEKCLKRDGYTCRICKEIGGRLEVHHLYGYAKYKNKRFDTTNGIVLCKNCHIDFHKKYGKDGQNTKQQFEEYLLTIGKNTSIIR